MSKIRAIMSIFRIDKLISTLKELFTADPLFIICCYLGIALNIIMMTFIMWLFKWCLQVSF